MAKASTRLNGGSKPAPPPTPAADDDDDTDFVQALFGELGDITNHVVKVRVYRCTLGAAGGSRAVPMTYLFDVAPDVSAIGDIPQTLLDYGNGTYRVVVYCDGKVSRREDITIERPPGWTPKVVPPPAPALPPTETSALAAAIQQQGELLRQLFDRLTKAPAPADSTTTLERAVELVAKLMPQPAAAPAPSLQGGIDLFTKGVEFAQSFAGGDKPTSMLDLVKEFITSGALQEFMKQQAAQMAGVPRAPLVPPTSPQSRPTMPAAPSANAQPVGGQDALQQMIAYLLGRARLNASPELYAEWLWDNADEATLRQLLKQADLVEQFEVASPAISQHKAWFVTLIDEARAMAGDGEGDGDDAGEPGDDTNGPGGHAGDPEDNATDHAGG